MVRPSARRIGAVLAAPATAAAALLLLAGPAQANEAESVTPSSGARLTSSPGEVRIVFQRPVLALVSVSVSGPGGDARGGGVQVRGDTVIQPLAGSLPVGSYSVQWQLSSLLDGGAGSSGFRIAHLRSTPTRRPTPSPTPSPTRSPTRSPTPSPTPSRTPSPTPSPTTERAVPPEPTLVAAPAVQGVGPRGGSGLLSPVVLWGALLVLVVVGHLIRRWWQVGQRQARRHAGGATGRRTGPHRAGGRSPTGPDRTRNERLLLRR